MYKLPKEKCELTDEIRIDILNSINGYSYDKVFQVYGKYFHKFSDILFTSTTPMEEIIFILKFGKPEPCEYGNVGKFKKHKGYNKFCNTVKLCKCKKEFSSQVQKKIQKTNIEKYGKKSTLMVDEIKERIKETNMERYGAENPFASDEVKEKIKETNMERYGVEYSGQIPEGNEKRTNTFIKKYGVVNPFMDESVKEKSKQTCLDKYGKEYYNQTDEHKESCKKTNMERYGVEYTLQSGEIREKGKKTMLLKYGVENPTKNKMIMKKIINTTVKNSMEKYGTVHYTQQNFTDIGKELIKDPELFQGFYLAKRQS
jgi:hypothetical protein